MKHDEKIIVIGLGYIGLPTAALIASKGFKVHGVDINAKAVDTINDGRIHIVEPSLEGLVYKGVKDSTLHADTVPQKGDVFIIAVPTPLLEDKKPDITYVIKATESIIPFIEANNLILLESTSPVGTTEKIAKLIFSKRPELKDKISIAYCPERVIPGKILYELEHNDRVVGGINNHSTSEAIKFYNKFVIGNVLETNARTAEMVKLSENSYRDVNIALANELSIICDDNDIDVNELIKLSNHHPRVNILQPGCGVGGHCIAIDPWFIVDLAPEKAQLIKTARIVNDNKPEWIVNQTKEKIENYRKKHGKDPVIGILGLSYKPDVDDLRESPALQITKMLAELGHVLHVVEPNIPELPGTLKKYSNIRKIDIADLYKCSFSLLLVKHKEFRIFPDSIFVNIVKESK